MPLLPLAALLHLRVKFAAVVCGRTGHSNQGGGRHRAALEHHVLGDEPFVDGLQDLRSQLIPLKHTPEPQDDALVGQPFVPALERSGTRETPAFHVAHPTSPGRSARTTVV